MAARSLAGISRFTKPRIEDAHDGRIAKSETGYLGDRKDDTMTKRTAWLAILATAIALCLLPQRALALTETTVDMAGAAVFPPNTVYQGYPLSNMRYGVGVSVFSDGTATGDVDMTFVGSLGTYILEGKASSGSVPKAGQVIFSGLCNVDMGNGTVYTNLPFSAKVDNSKQTLQVTISSTVLNIATGDKGRITIK